MKYPISNTVLYNIVEGYNLKAQNYSKSSFWSNFLLHGSHLWMDTGDLEKAKTLWTEEFTALTTNNTLINIEVQKGKYDKVINDLSKQLSSLPIDEKVREISLCINAIHGLCLAKVFNCKVSVELHTQLANDIEGTIQTAKRLFTIGGNHFIIKVPLTASGLISAKRLHDEGVPVNLTLGFSTRQNVIASMVAKPSYSNVFLSRLDAYFTHPELADIHGVGKKVVDSTLHCMRKVSEQGYSSCQLIVASIRNAEQLNSLMGADVLTIPWKVVAEAQSNELMTATTEQEFACDEALIVKYNLKHLWQVSDQEKNAAIKMSNKLPDNQSQVLELLNDLGCHNLFPEFTDEENELLASDGKIPKHDYWNSRIENYTVGIDALLSAAGLKAFEKDQVELDQRIADMI
ncbi:transaldolase family protein [Carboxylicivirga sp. M1479]|uniref:transaldolase family protein n=1 Tax=Carboxylicivirga sp. M1479 TaxID=2594476 RepID=UPI00163D7C58|nr:transaldolase family protein [Carboxylicivirga sp. M1479]